MYFRNVNWDPKSLVIISKASNIQMSQLKDSQVVLLCRHSLPALMFLDRCNCTGFGDGERPWFVRGGERLGLGMERDTVFWRHRSGTELVQYLMELYSFFSPTNVKL